VKSFRRRCRFKIVTTLGTKPLNTPPKPFHYTQGNARKANYIAFLKRLAGCRFESYPAHHFFSVKRYIIEIAELGIIKADLFNRRVLLEQTTRRQPEHSGLVVITPRSCCNRFSHGAPGRGFPAITETVP
jgi:hypothetical protein